jgi:alkylation response protein AidB-like acyl-CoA dehydrogenase
MDIGFTEERDLLRTSARRFLENECPTAFVRQRVAEPATIAQDLWREFAEQGWFGILYPEEAGGSGLGLVDMTVLMEGMGRAVMPGPFFLRVARRSGNPRRRLFRAATGMAAAHLGGRCQGEPRLDLSRRLGHRRGARRGTARGLDGQGLCLGCLTQSRRRRHPIARRNRLHVGARFAFGDATWHRARVARLITA